MSYSYRNTHPTGSCEPLQYSKLFICHGLDVSELLHEQRVRNHLRLWHCHLPGSLPSPHTCPSTPALPQAHQPFPILIQGIYPTRFPKSLTIPRSVHSHPPPKTSPGPPYTKNRTAQTFPCPPRSSFPFLPPSLSFL